MLLGVAVITTSSVSVADYDSFSCVTNNNIELAHLQCVSCGISKYYADKGIEMTPSHRWLALLGLKVREEKLTHDGGKGPVSSTSARETFQKKVIQKIQEYGFCEEYIGKEALKKGRSRNMVDMTSEDWKMFYDFINRDKVPDQDAYDKMAEKLGFKSTSLFSSGGARRNMDYLFEGIYEDRPLSDKRNLFKEKLNQALSPEYSVSGERTERSIEFISVGDKDQGLRKCLADIKEKFFTNQMDDKETFKMCETIASACDLERTPFDKNDFCMRRGMVLRSALPGANPSRPLPPPPPPVGTQRGVK